MLCNLWHQAVIVLSICFFETSTKLVFSKSRSIRVSAVWLFHRRAALNTGMYPMTRVNCFLACMKVAHFCENLSNLSLYMMQVILTFRFFPDVYLTVGQ